ncbi:MAG TPA: hypothetical protein VN958_19360 [Chitinophagaceae bacterium]|nr:hypothetical protein [Chitinophagaceae bacterium]
MKATQIKLYDLLRKDLHLPDDKAAAFIAAVEGVVELELRNERLTLSTKEDIYRLELKIEQSNSDLIKPCSGQVSYNCLLY